MGCVSTALTDLGSGNRRSHIPAPVQPTNIPNLAPTRAPKSTYKPQVAVRPAHWSEPLAMGCVSTAPAAQSAARGSGGAPTPLRPPAELGASGALSLFLLFPSHNE